MSRKTYGRRRENETNVIQSVDSGNPSEVTNAAFVVATYKGKHRMKPDSGRVFLIISVGTTCLIFDHQNGTQVKAR
jgi:hypothetical protein